ncbi:MAG: AAA family ATPase, partial [Candidatus Saccharimonas aalborgensis]
MVTVISVTNQKGGVGKTTTAINTAYYLAKMGKSTLLIDFDPQGNATSGLGIDKQSLTGTMNDVILETKKLADVIVPTEQARLFLAPSTPELANAEVELAQANRRFSRLKNAIENGPAYDFIIIDSPPSLSLLTV